MSTEGALYLAIIVLALSTAAIILADEFLRSRKRRRRGSEVLGDSGANPA
jgi:hypothetical protein